jgi:hypothetical protein
MTLDATWLKKRELSRRAWRLALRYRVRRSAFLGGYREERGGLLMDMLAAAFWAFDLVLFVFCKAENQFKWLLTIFAIKLIAGHGNLRTTPEGGP